MIKLFFNKNTFVNLFFTVVLFGCASQSHQVINAYKHGDENMSCDAIQNEIARAEIIIESVVKDKSNISGAEVIDTVLWGPFSAVARNQNYKAALEAANKRLERLKILKNNKCIDTESDTIETKNKTSKQFKQLKAMYEAGDLTKSEYDIALEKLLN